ncbi:hypothetical protein ACJX0J_026180, partial [Zea mays]
MFSCLYLQLQINIRDRILLIKVPMIFVTTSKFKAVKIAIGSVLLLLDWYNIAELILLGKIMLYFYCQGFIKNRSREWLYGRRIEFDMRLMAKLVNLNLPQKVFTQKNLVRISSFTRESKCFMLGVSVTKLAWRILEHAAFQ